MPAPTPCVPCCSDPNNVQVPGVPGADGAAGADGLNAYTSLTDNAFVVPGVVGGQVTTTVLSTLWMVVGQVVIIGQGAGAVLANPGPATFEVVQIISPLSVKLQWLQYPNDVAGGTAISIDAIVSPSGIEPASPLAIANGGTGQVTRLAAITALIANQLAGVAALTDSTTGAASSTLAAGTGIQTLAFYVGLTNITNADIMTNYTLGYAFKLLAVNFVTDVVPGGAGKAATIQASISGVNVTGGVLALTTANTATKGVVVAGSAVTALNTGSNSATLSLTGSSVTAFTTQGAGWILLTVQNMDTANAASSLAAKINKLLTSLTT